MNENNYVSLLEPRCVFHINYNSRDSIDAEKVFFKIVIPDFDVPQAQLTGSRVYIAKIWEDKEKRMQDFFDENGIGKCLDSQMSNTVEEKVKAFKDLTKPESLEGNYLPYGRKNHIIGDPYPIIGVYVKFDSKEVHDKLKKFEKDFIRGRGIFNRLHIGKNEIEYNGYIPVENIIAYEVPKRFAEKEDNFTGHMLNNWPPTVEWYELIMESFAKKKRA